eukprot:gnl/MRDRNA2_/MRDRNA2_92996_c0_seq1.p1 gnl/MRDRNA2_/MRDRNA2_92996_c0~~gnl/MRDRNA2_/MRDRNA2_92996_c0_seq1.p1  ORF type:complete len:264 (-),score=89.23 gnl/MRDRNA2_/MRDRNA2_92996_c0_seq1:74-865(-)
MSADGVDGVVDPENLLEAATKLKAEGNEFLRGKQGQAKDAVIKYEQGISILDKCDGHPMLKEDVAKVLQLKAILFSNMSQALLKQELFRRALEAAQSCLQIDEANTKALYRQLQAHEALKMYKEAMEDLDKLEPMKDHGMSADDFSSRRQTYKKKQQDLATQKEEEAEEYDDTGMVYAKKAFDEICEKYALNDEETSAELADWLTLGKDRKITAQDCARRWQMDEDDAELFLRWINFGIDWKQKQAEEAQNDASQYAASMAAQ